jgi:hypothetical protein
MFKSKTTNLGFNLMNLFPLYMARIKNKIKYGKLANKIYGVK